MMRDMSDISIDTAYDDRSKAVRLVLRYENDGFPRVVVGCGRRKIRSVVGNESK